MVNIEYVRGNLINMAINGEFDAVAHGCNCFHTMGSGIAPLMNEMTRGQLLVADSETPYGDINKLGTTSSVRMLTPGWKELWVVNIYTQYTYGGQSQMKPNQARPVLVNWNAFRTGLESILSIFSDDMRLGIPLIGCGLAGGSRADFERVLKDIKANTELNGTIVVVEYNG